VRARRFGQILGHLTFVVAVVAGWVWVGCHNTGIVANIAIVLGAMHLGVVAYDNWLCAEGEG
jgi:hypothetical protein